MDEYKPKATTLSDWKKEAYGWWALCYKRNAEIAELKEMLDIAWDAVTEAGYEGFSNKLKVYMEKDDGCSTHNEFVC